MNPQPLVLLTFAEPSSQSKLNALKQEIKIIQESLNTLHREQVIRIETYPNIEAEFFFNRTIEFVNDGYPLLIFHFGGHAGQEQLFFEDQQVFLNGLSKLISGNKYKDFSLVFLNGCYTEGAVSFLHNLGIKAVIATSTPVEDNFAYEFAKTFYFTFGKEGMSLGQSFQRASEFIETISKECSFKTYYSRGLSRRQQINYSWGLYINAEEGSSQAFDILNWKIPRENISYQLRENSKICYESLLQQKGRAINSEYLIVSKFSTRHKTQNTDISSVQKRDKDIDLSIYNSITYKGF